MRKAVSTCGARAGSVGVDKTHDPRARSWIADAEDHADFPLQNLPFGIFNPPGGARRVGAAIGDHVVDLTALSDFLPEAARSGLAGDTLNTLFAQERRVRIALRCAIFDILSDPMRRGEVLPHLYRADRCTLHLPAKIGDYTDFYAGIHHARHVGRLFRPDNPLLPNYKYVPIAYHGRASSVRVSGEPVTRPVGQQTLPGSLEPVVGPTRRLDYELELGFWIGQGNADRRPIPVAEAADHIAGLSLLNDWSARDIQAWEYAPLGPFLGKNFHTTVSPWVITAEALAPFRIEQPPRPEGDPRPLDYLWDDHDQRNGAFAIELEVSISSHLMRDSGVPALRLGTAHASHMYWTAAQMVAHHSMNGCNLQPGDLLGTGTISGPGAEQCGSLLELGEGGREPVTLPTGEQRTFLEDGDELTLAATARREGFVPIGFGHCTARIGSPSG